MSIFPVELKVRRSITNYTYSINIYIVCKIIKVLLPKFGVYLAPSVHLFMCFYNHIPVPEAVCHVASISVVSGPYVK